MKHAWLCEMVVKTMCKQFLWKCDKYQMIASAQLTQFGNILHYQADR